MNDCEIGQDPLEHIRSKRPNALAAIDLFKGKWESKDLPYSGVEELVVTIFVDHCGQSGLRGPQRLAKTKAGYSAALALSLLDLTEGVSERSVEDITLRLEQQFAEVLAKPALVSKKEL